MSAPEETLSLHLKAEKIAFMREYRAIPNRKFAYDFRCYGKTLAPNVVKHMNEVLVEVQGGVWMKGNSAHSSGAGISRDCEKASLAAVHGYRLLQVTPAQIKSGKAIEWIKAALA